MALYLFTGCYPTSAFKGIGEIKPLELLVKMPVHVSIFPAVASSLVTPGALLNFLKNLSVRCIGDRKSNVWMTCDMPKSICYVMVLVLHHNAIMLSSHISLSANEAFTSTLEVWIWKYNEDNGDSCEGHGLEMVHGVTAPLWFDSEELVTSQWDISTCAISDQSD